MAQTLNEIIHAMCIRNNNYFVENTAQQRGDFELKGSEIHLEMDLEPGCWVLLSPGVGCFKVINKVDAGAGGFIYTLEDAEQIRHKWSGFVYEMALPLNFVKLAGRILEWVNSDEAKPSNLAGEGVAGVYTWRRAAAKNGLPFGWQELFAKELAAYRKYVTGVRP